VPKGFSASVKDGPGRAPTKAGPPTFCAHVAFRHRFRCVFPGMPAPGSGKHTGMAAERTAERTADAPDRADGDIGAVCAGHSALSPRDGPQDAVERGAWRGVVTVEIAGRRVELLPPEQLGYFAGLGLLVALGVIEWPVAAVVAVGHTLAFRSRRAGLSRFGAAIEKA
jgi:hypothetical protein